MLKIVQESVSDDLQRHAFGYILRVLEALQSFPTSNLATSHFATSPFAISYFATSRVTGLEL